MPSGVPLLRANGYGAMKNNTQTHYKTIGIFDSSILVVWIFTLLNLRGFSQFSFLKKPKSLAD